MTTTLSVKTIQALNPCNDRFKNYLNFYKDKEFTVKQFMGLKNITHGDKLWVAFRLMTREQAVNTAHDIASLVLDIFEKRYPGDLRVRECLEAVKLYQKGKITLDQLNEKRAGACAAADAAADACAACAAAGAAAKVRAKQEKLQLAIVFKYWK